MRLSVWTRENDGAGSWNYVSGLVKNFLTACRQSPSPASSIMCAQAETGGTPSLVLQVAVLRHIPTPVIVLSPKRESVFANRAAERMLGFQGPIQSPSAGIAGQSPAALGIKLLFNRQWEAVLDELVSAHGQTQSEESESAGTHGPVHDVEAVVLNTHSSFGERHFRVNLSALNGGDGMYYLLSFERSMYAENRLVTPREDAMPPRGPSMSEAGSSTTPKPRLHSGVEISRDISRIKKAVFDSSGNASFILTVDGKLYLANKRAREAFGGIMGSPEGCKGPSLRNELDIWDEKFERRLEQVDFPGMKLITDRQAFTNYRCGFVHSITGDRIVMSVDGECLYDDDTGEFIGGICWCRDLQEFSGFVADQQLRRLRSHETICNLMPHLVWTTTPEGYCDWFSEGWCNFTGMSAEESMGDGFQDAIHPDDLQAILDKWAHHQSRGQDCEVEVRYRRHDGVYKWMLARARPLRDGKGKILKWYGTNTDIHDLVMARIDAARNKLQILTVLAHTEVNLFTIDKNRKIVMAEGGMKWKSLSNTYDVDIKSSLIGQDAIELARSTQAGGLPDYEKNVLDILSGKVDVAQSEDLIGDRIYRTRVVADLAHDAVDGGQKPEVMGVLGLTIDVTDMKARVALEVENSRLMIEEQASRDSNSMKSQFLANMSHEMRTPTAGVIGMAELLGEDAGLTTEQREYVNSIQLSAKALLTIVNDVLDFSKIESGRLDVEEVPFNLATAVGELTKLLGLFAHQKGLKFIYENTMDEGLEVLGDPGRTRQVLSNLLTNALKFTREGSVKLSVSSSPVHPEMREGELVEVQFVIEDTGIGIEKTVLDKLFKPFSQGDSSTARLFGGTGLGLTISKNLAHLMHGSIKLESRPNVGSKATFTIPLKVSSWCAMPSTDAFAKPSLGFGKHVPPNSPPTIATPLSQLSLNYDLLNQQISSSVTTSYSPPVKSSPRQGSIDAVASSGAFAQLTPEQRSKLHVLVVEDNPINQTIAIRNIRNLGFPVTAVWNGSEALAYLRSPSPSKPRPAIILMDVQMPVMDGYEATRILRTDEVYATPREESAASSITAIDEEGTQPDTIMEGRSASKGGNGLLRDIPVIAMTASAIQGDKEKCHDAGMDDYLAKPVEKAKLEEMLIKWARRRRDHGS